MHTVVKTYSTIMNRKGKCRHSTHLKKYSYSEKLRIILDKFEFPTYVSKLIIWSCCAIVVKL
jgi:hypothetical protein